MSLPRRIKFINILKHVINIRMKNTDFIFEIRFTYVPLPNHLPLNIKSKIMQNRKGYTLEKKERYIDLA